MSDLNYGRIIAEEEERAFQEAFRRHSRLDGRGGGQR